MTLMFDEQEPPMIILLDQDGVLADFERGFFEAWSNAGHAHPAVLPKDRRNYSVRGDYPVDLWPDVELIYTSPGFYRTLPVMPGALEAVQSMVQLGYDVRICTSPLDKYRNCVTEKYEWVEEHLGAAFVAKMILTKDKTLVAGDYLVDDRPTIRGARYPIWQHVYFDQPYNRNMMGLRMTWTNWRMVLMTP